MLFVSVYFTDYLIKKNILSIRTYFYALQLKKKKKVKMRQKIQILSTDVDT